MGQKLHILTVSFLLLLITYTSEGAVFDVTTLGAKADGQTDAAQAMTDAFKSACNSTEPSQVLVPKGEYSLSEVVFAGPCKAPVEFTIQGTLRANPDPKSFKTDSWVTFQRMDGFKLNGGGVFDGQGPKAWAINNCAQNSNCGALPISLRLNFINNSVIEDITSLDSKNFHVNLMGSGNVTFQKVTITAPVDAPNTDGIHIGRVKDIKIHDSKIGTGDDCISIGEGSESIDISGIECGPGHGISVGSLGRYATESPVLGVTVANCVFNNTMFGARIKSWPKNPTPGTASEMHYSNLTMNNVTWPVLIDQEYCPHGQCSNQTPSTIKMSKISFKDIKGTCSTTTAVKLSCSSSNPCEGVEIGTIDLKHEGAGDAKFMCKNVTPTLSGTQTPAACSSPDAPLVDMGGGAPAADGAAAPAPA